MSYYFEDADNVRRNMVTIIGGFGNSYNAVIDTSIIDEDGIVEPVTLTEAKLFCKIDVDEDDSLIEDTIIPAARQMCEKFTNIGFVEAERVAVLRNNNGGIFLPYGPISDAEDSISIDIDGVIEDTGSYEVTGVKWKQLKTAYDYCTITYTGGYATLPKLHKTALLNAIYYMYDNRAVGVDDIGPIAKMLLTPISRNG